MKRTLQIILIVVIGGFFLYLFILEEFTSIDNYLDSSTEVNLNNIQISNTEYKKGINYSLFYRIAYSKEKDKYFVLLFFTQKRYGSILPIIPKDIKDLVALVNSDLLNNPKYGSIENPIPIMNYKLDNEYVFDEKQYKYNIRKYKAYCWYVKFD